MFSLRISLEILSRNPLEELLREYLEYLWELREFSSRISLRIYSGSPLEVGPVISLGVPPEIVLRVPLRIQTEILQGIPTGFSPRILLGDRPGIFLRAPPEIPLGVLLDVLPEIPPRILKIAGDSSANSFKSFSWNSSKSSSRNFSGVPLRILFVGVFFVKSSRSSSPNSARSSSGNSAKSFTGRFSISYFGSSSC